MDEEHKKTKVGWFARLGVAAREHAGLSKVLLVGGFGSGLGAAFGVVLGAGAWLVFSQGVAAAALLPLAMAFARSRGAALALAFSYGLVVATPQLLLDLGGGWGWSAGLVPFRVALLALTAYVWSVALTPAGRVPVALKVFASWWLTLLTPFGMFGFAHPVLGWGFLGTTHSGVVIALLAPVATAAVTGMLLHRGAHGAGKVAALLMSGVFLLTAGAQEVSPPRLQGKLVAIQRPLSQGQEQALVEGKVLALLQALGKLEDWQRVSFMATPLGSMAQPDLASGTVGTLQGAVDESGITVVLGLAPGPLGTQSSLVLRPGVPAALNCSLGRESGAGRSESACMAPGAFTIDKGVSVYLQYPVEEWEPSAAAARLLHSGANAGAFIGGSQGFLGRVAYRVALKHYMGGMHLLSFPFVVAQLDQII